MTDPRYSTTLAREVYRAFSYGWAFGVLCGMVAGFAVAIAFERGLI